MMKGSEKRIRNKYRCIILMKSNESNENPPVTDPISDENISLLAIFQDIQTSVDSSNNIH